MKKKIILFSFALTALVLSGCNRNNAQTNPNTVESNTADSNTAGSNMTGSDMTGSNTAGSNTATDVPAPTAAAQNNTVSNNDTHTSMITEEEAKLIALNHAGLTAEHVTFVKSGIDRDDGRENYDVEFYTEDHKEYDYKIDPYTGSVLDYDYDAEYYKPDTDTHDENVITADAAKKIALDQVSGATTEHIREFETDYNNGRLQYEGKIYHDHKEYEFEIDAYDGTILEWDVETIYGGNQ